VVTNIDADHLDTYDGDFEKLKQTFVDFLMHLPFYGLAIVCIDDEHIQDILARVARPVRTYGFSEAADIRAHKVRQHGQRMIFDVSLPDGVELTDVVLNLSVDADAIRKALMGFEGIGRRVQSHGMLACPDGGEAALYDDYGHHPTEVAATLAAIRGGWPEKRLVVVFQPHRYTRTRDLFEDFAASLSNTDVLVLTEVYAAGEERINGADGRALARAIRNHGAVDPIFVESIDDVPATLARVMRDGDLVLTLGAGSVGGLAASLPVHFAAEVQHG